MPWRRKELNLVCEVAPLLDAAVDGRRLTPDQGLALLESNNLAALGRAADVVTRRLHPGPYRTYNIDRNINYTNVCTAVCDFCAFYRPPKHAEGYVLSREALLQKVQETVELGGDQILMQGGLHPEFKLEWYEELLRDIKARFPNVNIHGFSPPEIHHFTKVSKLPLKTVLARLQAAGLGSLPGGGGEILVDRVRKEITRGKVLTDDWLNVCRVWHELGGRGSATMMFGHIETYAERIEHLERLRQLQDETGGYTAFICWTMQPEHTEMAQVPPAGAFDYLKTQAVSRLYLDNFQNVQSSWVTQGLKVGQVALEYGANDMGSLMIEENVVASAGTVHCLTLEQIQGAIRELGYIPRQRNVFYQLIDEPPGPRDVAQGPWSPRSAHKVSSGIGLPPGEPLATASFTAPVLIRCRQSAVRNGCPPPLIAIVAPPDMIHAHQLTKTYADLRRGKFVALDGLSFQAAAGQIYGLLGPNGAGKTTALRILGTVLRPTRGTATVNGYDVVTQPAEVRRQIGFVSANTGTYDRMTAWETVEYFGRLYGIDGEPLRARMEELFARLQMNEIRDRLGAKMSTGMRQKTSIARALVHDPPVLIFDEPTTGLDVLSARSLLGAVADLREQGKCVIFSTHIMREVEKLCDRIAIMYRGRILAEGTLPELRERHGENDLEELFFQLISAHEQGAAPAFTA